MGIETFIQELHWDRIPDTARRMARRCVLDAVGCGLAGLRAKGFADVAACLIGCGPDEASPVWGTGVTTSVPWAIFLNSFGASYFDLDDGHRLAQGHPGAAIIPACLAVAGRFGNSGRELLTAVVCGYEVAIRSALIMRSLGGPRKGSGAWISPGVAAATAKLMRMKEEEIVHAIGLAEFYAPQAPQDRSSSHPSMMKEGIPWGAYTGSMAAYLASNGFRAMPPFLGDSPWTSDLGSTFEIERVYFKRYAACRFIHPVLDGLARMREEMPVSPEQIDRIDIWTFEKGLLLDQREPSDVVAAAYSFPFAVASYLRYGCLGPEEVSGQALEDPLVLNLSRRISLREDKELTSLFPERCLARMIVVFRDGSSVESGLLSAKGDPDNPLMEGELLSKFRTLAEPSFGHAWHRFPHWIACLEKTEAAMPEMIKLLSGRLEPGS